MRAEEKTLHAFRFDETSSERSIRAIKSDLKSKKFVFISCCNRTVPFFENNFQLKLKILSRVNLYLVVSVDNYTSLDLVSFENFDKPTMDLSPTTK